MSASRVFKGYGFFANAIILFILLVSVHVASAQTNPVKAMYSCDFGGWEKSAQKNIPVHTMPEKSAPILGYIPATKSDSEYQYTIGFGILEARDGWVKIVGANDDLNLDDGAKPRKVYSGEGWIPGRYVDFVIQSGYGYERPDAKSKRIVNLKGQWASSVGTVEQVVACSGEWAQVDLVINPPLDPDSAKGLPAPGTRYRAWFRRICDIQETTCDGVGD